MGEARTLAVNGLQANEEETGLGTQLKHSLEKKQASFSEKPIHSWH